MSRPYTGNQLRASAVSHRGRVRQNNQDSISIWREQELILAIVADGMGGAAGGEEASRIAVETIRAQLLRYDQHNHEFYSQAQADELQEQLSHAVHQANLSILQQAQLNPELNGMGTTVTMAFTRDNEVLLAHVGDSRAYLVDGFDSSIHQITSDHSFVQALLDAGYITPAEADEHPMKNVLYRALGQAPELDVDIINGVYLNSGDRLILCSDGLTLHVHPSEIAQVALEHDDPQIIGEKLVTLANSRGGRDNISVVVIILDGLPPVWDENALPDGVPFEGEGQDRQGDSFSQ